MMDSMDSYREAEVLREMFPIIWDVGVWIKCPSEVRGDFCTGEELSGRILHMITHLNDDHGWPRTEKDRNEDNKYLPTIYGWLKEEVEKNGWDLTCRLPQP